MKKILILHTSVGYGPKIVAENIANYLKQYTDWEIKILDVMKEEQGRTVSGFERLYLFIIEKTGLWGWLYRTSLIHNSLVYRLRYLMSWRGQKTIKEIVDYNPDVVLTTQTYPSALAAVAKRKYKWQGQLGIIFSDYHFQNFWVYPEADFFFCVTEDEERGLLEMGYAKDRIHRVGIPIHPKFFQKFDKKESRNILGLPNDNVPLVVVTGGRRALLASEKIIKSIAEEKLPIRLLVLAGKNQKILERMKYLRENLKVDMKILGFVDQMERVIAAADVFISKPGGPSISEAVAQNIPVIVTDAHPGHEQANFDYLVRKGYAFGASHYSEIPKILKTLLDNQEKISEKTNKALALVNPKVHEEIMKAIDLLL